VDDGVGSRVVIGVVFCLLGATLRWMVPGALLTAAAIMVAAFAVELYPLHGVRGTGIDPATVAIWTAGVCVIVLCGFLGRRQARDRELGRFGQGPSAVPQEAGVLLRAVLQEAADLIQAPRVLLVWETSDAPGVHFALWSPERFSWVRDTPEKFDPLIADRISSAAFVCDDVTAAAPGVGYIGEDGRIHHWRGTPVHPALIARFAIRSVLATPLDSDTVVGWLCWLDRPDGDPDDLALATVAARQATARLDYFNIMEKRREAAAAEGTRLARDRHDGLLQSLTALALKLETLHSSLGSDPDRSAALLTETKGLVVAEQRHLRRLIGDLRPAPNRDSSGPLRARLRALSR
jgi:signal transduction histidine kinase